MGMTVYDEELQYYEQRAAAASNAAQATLEPEPEVVVAAPAKTKFDVKLLGYDDTSKIKVIKEVRAIAGLGLKEAKEFVESAPKVLQKDLSEEQAQELKQKLEAVGAQIEIL
jgi:large subunit ribosomal protein L7/L12